MAVQRQPSPPGGPGPPGTSGPETGLGPRLLRRSRTDRVIAGVCGGAGRYFGIDPLLIRIAFVVLTMAGGSGILIYLLAWLLIPEERPGDAGRLGPPAGRGGAGAARMVLGTVLIAAGAILLVQQFEPAVARVIWPLTLVALGILVVVQGIRR